MAYDHVDWLLRVRLAEEQRRQRAAIFAVALACGSIWIGVGMVAAWLFW